MIGRKAKMVTANKDQSMSGDVWMSGLIGLPSVGDMQGLHDKYYGEEWRPAQHEIPLHSEKVKVAYKRHWKGLPLERSDFPEALAVFDETRFRRIEDLFMAGPFYAVKGELAGVLSRFHLGDGGLIPFPVYREDKRTPVEGDFFLLNFGGPKDSLMPGESRNIEPFYKDEVGRQVWVERAGVEDDDVAVSHAAFSGADLWVETRLFKKVFLSGALADALKVSTINVDFELRRCRVMDSGTTDPPIQRNP